MPSTGDSLVVGALDAATFRAGEVVHVSGNRRVARAQANAPGNLSGAVGVALGGDFVFDGVATVLLEPGLSPVAGQPLYVSATAGRATNVIPVQPKAFATVYDASLYASLGTVIALIGDASGLEQIPSFYQRAQERARSLIPSLVAGTFDEFYEDFENIQKWATIFADPGQATFRPDPTKPNGVFVAHANAGFHFFGVATVETPVADIGGKAPFFNPAKDFYFEILNEFVDTFPAGADFGGSTCGLITENLLQGIILSIGRVGPNYGITAADAGGLDFQNTGIPITAGPHDIGVLKIGNVISMFRDGVLVFSSPFTHIPVVPLGAFVFGVSGNPNPTDIAFDDFYGLSQKP